MKNISFHLMEDYVNPINSAEVRAVLENHSSPFDLFIRYQPGKQTG